jgi:hypothetical protein
MGMALSERKGFAMRSQTAILKIHAKSSTSPSMNAQDDLSMKNEDVLRVELEVFRQEHRDLDEAISALVERGTGDQLTIQRLKKQKLRLKDKIAFIEDRLTPDIIA